MAITADYHLHTSHSGDSGAPMESMIQRGIALGLTHMCFTEHNDMDYPPSEEEPENIFLLDTDDYQKDFFYYKEKYTGRIDLRFGVELGLQPQLAAHHSAYVQEYPFDFVIGSSHLCHGKDPYYPAFYAGRSEEEAYREYFASIIENISCYSDFDVYGHLDYVVRYGPNRDRNYSYKKYRDLFDELLKLLIAKGRGIEINTGGVRKGLRELHPCTAVIKRYRELGGEIITVGSDAHEPDRIAASFDRAQAVLEDCGFRYYTVFEERKPHFQKLG